MRVSISFVLVRLLESLLLLCFGDDAFIDSLVLNTHGSSATQILTFPPFSVNFENSIPFLYYHTIGFGKFQPGPCSQYEGRQ
jgi:hypothetical protein